MVGEEGGMRGEGASRTYPQMLRRDSEEMGVCAGVAVGAGDVLFFATYHSAAISQLLVERRHKDARGR